MIRVDRRELSRALFFVTVLALCSAQAFAQAVAVAQMNGQVSDATGSGIPGASVKAFESNRGVSHDTVTDAQGRYTLTNLPVGAYRLEISASGFKNYIQTGLQLQVGDNVQINAALQVGAV